MKGRKPLPSELLLLTKGKLYGDQKERAENEPGAIKTVEPTCPYYFRPSEREAWDYLSGILKNYSLYIDINSPFLELAAVYLAEFRNSQWELIIRGGSVESRAGKKRERNKAAELLMKQLIELNVSASGLARLGAAVVKGGKKTSEMEDLLD